MPKKVFFIFVLILLGFVRIVEAAKLPDGTWTQSGSPGTTVINFTNGSTQLDSGDYIVLTFSSAANINSSGTNITVTSQSSPTRVNNANAKQIRIILDSTINASDSVTITMSNALSTYTSATYEVDSVSINTYSSTGQPIDNALAVILNDTTTVHLTGGNYCTDLIQQTLQTPR